jgi:multiple sugar transport system substrate-binding protein
VRTRPSSVTIAAAVCVVVVAGSAAGIAAFGATHSSSRPTAASGRDGHTTVTVRLWDEGVAAGYEKSFATFERDNPTIDVDVEVVPYADYAAGLESDVDAGTAPDVYWLNSAAYADQAQAGDLLDVDQVLGASAHRAWSPAVTEQYTLDGHLWGVPQLSDGGVALYYNADLLAAAGVDPAALDDLTWAPGGGEGDTLLPVLEQLTRDAEGRSAADPAFNGTPVQYGYNAGEDLQAIWLDYLGSNGASLEDATGTSFALDTPEAQAAFQYVVDLVQQHRVAPPASLTNADPDYSRDQFTSGHMALFQSGLYSLAPVAAASDFTWGVARMPAGPEGRVSVSNGIVAAGNAHTSHLDATARVLAWLGSTDGSRYIGAEGAAVPAVLGAQAAYYEHWSDKGVDVSPFFDVVASGRSVPAPTGIWGDAQPVVGPVLDEMFLGTTTVEEALARAQELATATLEDDPEAGGRGTPR